MTCRTRSRTEERTPGWLLRTREIPTRRAVYLGSLPGLGQGQAVHVGHLPGPHRGYRLTGHDYPHQVERISRVDHHPLLQPWRLAGPTQLLDGAGQRVLLPAETTHEPSPANQSAIFKPAEGPLNFPPRQAKTVTNCKNA